MIHELCSELIFTSISYAHRNMLLSIVSQSHQVSVSMSKVSKISMLSASKKILFFLLFPSIKSEALHTEWFTSSSFQAFQRSYQRRQMDTEPVRLQQFLHYRKGTQPLTTALAMEGTCTESRAGQGEASQPTGCPDHASICQSSSIPVAHDYSKNPQKPNSPKPVISPK